MSHEANPRRDYAAGDIIQVSPTARVRDTIKGALVVIDEVRSWGVLGYFNAHHSPHVVALKETGIAYVRLQWDDFEPTGGSIIWKVSHTGEKNSD